MIDCIERQNSIEWEVCDGCVLENGNDSNGIATAVVRVCLREWMGRNCVTPVRMGGVGCFRRRIQGFVAAKYL